jgi:hypothetical protein
MVIMTAAHSVVQDFTAMSYQLGIVHEHRFQLRYVPRTFSMKDRDRGRSEYAPVTRLWQASRQPDDGETITRSDKSQHPPQRAVALGDR